MNKACRLISLILCTLSGIASAATAPAKVFPIRSLVGDEALGRSLRAFEDEKSQQLLFVSLVQIGEPQLSFDKDQFEWASNAINTVISNINSEMLGIYMRAAADHFHPPQPDYNPVASSEALQEEVRRQKLRLVKMGRCLGQPRKPGVGIDALPISSDLPSLRRLPIETINPPAPQPKPAEDEGPTVDDTAVDTTADEICMDIRPSPIMKEDVFSFPPAGESSLNSCQPPAYVSEMIARDLDLEQLYTRLCWKNLLSFPQNPKALDQFTGFILDLPYFPQRIMRIPTLTARFRIATVPTADARKLVSGLALPKPWTWANFGEVAPRTINRPTSLLRDQLAYSEAWIHDTDLYVQVHYWIFR